MKSSRQKHEPPEFLFGWKDIANHLGMGVRTVQRYERLHGLPVRRPAGKQTGAVVATKVELDAWVSASPIREAFHLTRVATFPEDTADAIQKNMAKMGRLRDEMKSLRDEVRGSVRLLRASIQSVRGDLGPDEWNGNRPHQVPRKRFPN